MNTLHGRRRRGGVVLAAVGALALLTACATGETPQAETESIAPGGSPPAGVGGTPSASGPPVASDPDAGGEGTPADAGGGDGRSRDAPASPGRPLEIGDWVLAVQPTNPDAADVIQAENRFNRPPPDGHVFALARVDVRYQGEGSGQAWLELGFQVLTPDGNTYGGYDARCGVVPGDLDDIGEMFAGASASGNVCAAVPAGQAEGAMWVIDERFPFGDDSRLFVAFE